MCAPSTLREFHAPQVKWRMWVPRILCEFPAPQVKWRMCVPSTLCEFHAPQGDSKAHWIQMEPACFVSCGAMNYESTGSSFYTPLSLALSRTKAIRCPLSSGSGFVPKLRRLLNIKSKHKQQNEECIENCTMTARV